MDTLNINNLLDREKLKESIIQCITTTQLSLSELNTKRIIYLHGAPGIGKTYFIEQLLNELNYDIIHFETEQNRNSTNFDFIKEFNMSNHNVLELLKGKRKKLCVLMDNIDAFHCGDKGVLPNLIKLLRPKKTIKQKKEAFCKNIIICIGNNSNDKKIIELKKICYSFELSTPTNLQLSNIIKLIVNNGSESLRHKIVLFIENDLRKLTYVIDMYSKFNIKEMEDILDTLVNKHYCDGSKEATRYLLTNNIDMSRHEEIIHESDRTIIGLLYHENIIDYINEKNPQMIELYTEMLNNFCLGDFFDKITFQKQIWQFNEMTSLIKIITNNHLFCENIKPGPIKDIRFTKVLTKYSTEYNNIVFIINLCQKMSIDKIDLLEFFNQNWQNFSEEDYLYYEQRYEIKKLDIMRLVRYIENKSSKEIKSAQEMDDAIDVIDEGYE